MMVQNYYNLPEAEEPRVKSHEPVIYQLDKKEVHMMYKEGIVGVVWNCKGELKTLEGEDGIEYRAVAPVRDGKPYIQFISIRNWGKGDYTEDEDSPVDGGFSPEGARRFIQELQWAIDYIQQFLK